MPRTDPATCLTGTCSLLLAPQIHLHSSNSPLSTAAVSHVRSSLPRAFQAADYPSYGDLLCLTCYELYPQAPSHPVSLFC